MTDDALNTTWPKHCACGLSFGRAEWLDLHSAGRWCVDDLTLDLRTCPCGSTISIPVEALTERHD